MVSKRLVLVLPAENLHGRQLHISTALAGCWRARLPRCAPAGTEPPVASAIAASLTCGSSKRDGLAAGCSVAGCCVTGCSVAGCCVAGCSVAGCSVVMNGQCGGCVQGRCESGWAASRTCTVTQLEVRCQGWCGRSSCSDGIFGKLAGTAASRLPAFTSAHSTPLSSKVSPLLPEPTLTTICLGLDGAPSSSFTARLATECGAGQWSLTLSEGGNSSQKLRVALMVQHGKGYTLA